MDTLKKAKLVKAIHINAKEKRIELMEIEDSLERLQAAVEGPIESAGKIGNGLMYVNEEGLLEPKEYGFVLSGRSYYGNGLIVGLDSKGDSKDTNVKVSWLHRHVGFWNE